MAEWLGKGLQNPLHRFNSGSDLKRNASARVVELVDTRDLKSLDRKIVRVRVSPRAQRYYNFILCFVIFLRRQMKKALVIIDLQKGFINRLTQDLPKKVNKFIKSNGKKYDLLIFTQYINHSESNFVKQFNYKRFVKKNENGLASDIKEFVRKDNLFIKDTYGSFVNNKVLKVFKKYKIKEVHLAGIDTENCVLTFARDAFDRGYKVVALGDLCKSHSSLKLHKAALEIIKDNIGMVM